jgi:hypothetical protein
MSTLMVVLVASSAVAQSAGNGGPPFPGALDDARIEVDRLDGMLEHALILGNGDINALLYADEGRLSLMLTKNDVWDARLETARDPPLPTIELIERLAGEAAPVHRSAYVGESTALEEGWGRHGRDAYHANPYPCPRPCGRVVFGDPATTPPRVAFEASLDPRRAVARVRHGRLQRGSVRALAQRNVFLITWPEPASLLEIASKDVPGATFGEADGVKWLHQTLPGDGDYPGMEFAVAVAELIPLKAIAIVTSREAGDCRAEAVRLARGTLAASIESLIEDHEAVWNDYWSASGVELDDAFCNRVWYRSLYFLRCVSKPGVVAPGLYAGLLNSKPVWHGDYHTNYNEQATFWSCHATNHPELAEPYDRLIRDYLKRAQWIAGKIFSLEGAYYPLNIFAYEPEDPTSSTMPNNRQYIHHVWSFTQGVNGFAAQPLWLHYKYAPDLRRLEETVYPVIREVAIFQSRFLDRCEKDDAGKAVVAPTISPEHWGWTKDLERNRNCTFDIAMFRYLFEAAIEGARTLDRDAEWVAKWEASIGLLPPYPTTGGSEPVVVDVLDAPPTTYNIAVPATPVFPCDVVTWRSPADERALFARTIETLEWNGTNSTFMLGVSRARLGMPGAFDWLRDRMLVRARANGTLALNLPGHRVNGFGHYTEQFSAAMAICEWLAQSVGDVVRVFPAWPADRDARFAHLRTQGGFLVTASHADGRVGELAIESTVGGRLRLVSPWAAGVSVKRDGGPAQRLTADAEGIVEIETKAGERMVFEPR